ncbi:hypothetical protein O181_109836 [Austropuccinia psidii MF-1]|uniref:Uncharacterized protein n=1 Tax=Austropuccinia psidii MF-1 TaxID=1389203 RepID=A0A9Q3JXG5_9BASI|nr:hypothetical protein [Austropuccinia psidii MF-1]
MGGNSCSTIIGPHGVRLALVSLDQANSMWAPTGKSWMCLKWNSLGMEHHPLIGSIGDPEGLASCGSQQYLISCLPQPLVNSGTSQRENEAKTIQRNRVFPSSQPTAQKLRPVSANMTASEFQRILDFTWIKHIHFGHVAIFLWRGLLLAFVKFQPFTTVSEVEVHQWD